MNRKIKKGLKEAKEGKVITVNRIEELFKERRAWKKKHPIMAKIQEGYYTVVRFFDRVKGIPRRIKWFIQRGKRGWADCDTWDFSYYLARVISEGLKHLKKYGHGATPTSKEYNTMIKTFETAKKISAGQMYYFPSDKFNWNQYRKLKKLTKKLNRRYHQKDRVMTRKEAIRFEKGFQIFVKHFFALWD